MLTILFKNLPKRRRMNMTECEHQNIKEHGKLQKQVLVVKKDSFTLEDIPNTFVIVEECTDCGEIRKEIIREYEVQASRNQSEYNRHSYVVSKEYFTNAGHLVEHSKSGDWYWNGQKMSTEQLQTRLSKTGDAFGDQNVSDNFKDICREAKYKSLKIKYEKDESETKLREAFN